MCMQEKQGNVCVLIDSVLQHINSCGLLNVRSVYTNIKYI